MDAYAENFIATLGRVSVFFVILFLILPRALFGKKGNIAYADITVAGIILLTSFFIALVYLFSLVRIYDQFTLMLSFLIFSSAFILSSEKWKRGRLFTKLNYHSLQLLEKNTIQWIRNKLFSARKISSAKTETYAIIWKILLLLVLIVSGIERLAPAFKIASPFSIEAYQSLEYVKALETKQLFYDKIFVAKGMHAIINIIYQFTRANQLTLIHIFGGVSSLFLVLAIYYVLFRSTGNRPAALIAAAIFGMFPGILPLNLESQVEANSIVLAAALWILNIYTLIEFAKKTSRSLFVLCLLGIFVSILISFFSTLILILVLPVISLAMIFRKTKKTVSFARKFWAILIFIISTAFIYFGQRILADNSLLLSNIRSLITDDLFMRFASEKMIFSKDWFFYGVTALSVLSIIFFLVLKKETIRLHYFVWGTLTFIMAAIWNGESMGLGISLNRLQSSFFLAVFSCVTMGLILYGLVFRLIENLSFEENVLPLRVTAIGLVVVLVIFEGLLFAKAPSIAKFNYQTEPEGYVRAIYKINKNYNPYEWMVVSHFGAKIQVAGYGRFMDYLYFLKYYNPGHFNQQAVGVIPAKYLFIFAEKDTLNSRVDSALLPKIEKLNKKVNIWCSQFARTNHNIDLFYEDQQVRVYRILIPQKKRTILDQLS